MVSIIEMVLYTKPTAELYFSYPPFSIRFLWSDHLPDPRQTETYNISLNIRLIKFNRASVLHISLEHADDVNKLQSTLGNLEPWREIEKVRVIAS